MTGEAPLVPGPEAWDLQMRGDSSATFGTILRFQVAVVEKGCSMHLVALYAVIILILIIRHQEL